jgi:hypothetical protein
MEIELQSNQWIEAAMDLLKNSIVALENAINLTADPDLKNTLRYECENIRMLNESLQAYILP